MKTLNDLTAPAAVTRRLLEKDVQKQCVDWARARGYWARKFSSMTQNSVPDYLFAREVTTVLDRYVAVENVPVRIKFACEFKRPGGKVTEAQEEELLQMEEAGWLTFVADDFAGFKEMVLRIERNQGLEI